MKEITIVIGTLAQTKEEAKDNALASIRRMLTKKHHFLINEIHAECVLKTKNGLKPFIVTIVLTRGEEVENG